ncbi:hypothetical protein ABBQ38_002113 [Trebouxia sp. C0009 RCD-2024]
MAISGLLLELTLHADPDLLLHLLQQPWQGFWMTWTASVCQDALLSKLFRLHDQQADALKSGAAVRQVANLSSTHHAMKACLRAWQAAINGSQPQMAKTGKAADKRLLTEGSRWATASE